MTNTTLTKNFLSLTQAADLLNISNATMRRLVSQNKIPAYQFGKQYRIEASTLEHYIQSSSISPTRKEDLQNT